MAESGGVLRELIATFSFGVDTSELKQGENRLEEFGKRIKQVGSAIAGAFAAKEIFEFVEGSVQAMTQIEHSATQLGISAEKVQEFQFAAKSMGMESEQLINMMGRLQVTQQAAASGSGEAAKSFSALGVNVKDANGQFKSADVLFADVAEGIKNIQDPSKQAAVATQLFGRQGRQLLPILKEGREGVEGLGEEFKALGGGYSEKALERSKQMEKQQARLNLALTSLRGVLTEALLPAVNAIVGAFSKAVVWFKDLAANTSIVETALGILGVAALWFAAKMAIANAPLVLTAALIGALGLVVEDIITMFRGGDSVIGRGIDALFGEGKHVEVVQALKHAWEGISSAVKVAWEYGSKFIGAMASIPDKLGKWMDQLALDDVKQMMEWANKNNKYNSIAGSDVPKSLSGDQYNAQTSSNVTVVVNAAPGQDPKKIGAGAVEKAHQISKRERRETAAHFQRARGS